MLKILKINCIIIFLLFFVAIIIGKSSVLHLDYANFVENVRYFTTPIEEVYLTCPDLKNILIDDKNIEEINDLFENSDDVLRIKVEDNPIFNGNGLLNKLKVLEIYKSNNNINTGDIIKVYDLISIWNINYINYYGGMTPLNENYEYVIFIKKAPAPNQKNTYIFSSIRYGHFNISIKQDNVLFDYSSGSKTMKEIIKYDYVENYCELTETEKCDDNIQKYSKLKRQILTYVNK